MCEGHMHVSDAAILTPHTPMTLAGWLLTKTKCPHQDKEGCPNVACISQECQGGWGAPHCGDKPYPGLR